MIYLKNSDIVKQDLTHEDIMDFFKESDRYILSTDKNTVRNVVLCQQQSFSNTYEILFRVYGATTYCVFIKDFLFLTKNGFVICTSNKPNKNGFYTVRSSYERVLQNVPVL